MLISYTIFIFILKSFCSFFPWDVILKFRDKIEKMGERCVCSSAVRGCEEKRCKKSEAQVRLLSEPDHRPCYLPSDGGCVCQAYQQPQAFAGRGFLQCAVFCVIRCGFHSSAVPTDQHNSSGSWRKGRRPQTGSLRGALVPDPRREEEGKSMLGKVPPKARHGVAIRPVVPLLSLRLNSWKQGLTQMPVCQCSLKHYSQWQKGGNSRVHPSRCVGTQSTVYAYSGAYGYMEYMGIWVYAYSTGMKFWHTLQGWTLKTCSV